MADHRLRQHHRGPGDRPHRGVHRLGRHPLSATTSHGTLRIGEVARGSVVLETSTGSIEIGIRERTAAYLNISSSRGRVHNSLSPSDSPDKSGDTVEVRARTRYGHIDVRRARTPQLG